MMLPIVEDNGVVASRDIGRVVDVIIVVTRRHSVYRELLSGTCRLLNETLEELSNLNKRPNMNPVSCKEYLFYYYYYYYYYNYYYYYYYYYYYSN